jgi:hypothetical protein
MAGLPLPIFLYGVAFFGLMVIVGVVQVHRKREKAYYFSALVSCIILVAFTFTFLNQMLLAFATIIAAGILSPIVTPKVMKVFEREPLRERAPRGIEQNKHSALASQSFFRASSRSYSTWILLIMNLLHVFCFGVVAAVAKRFITGLAAAAKRDAISDFVGFAVG